MNIAMIPQSAPRESCPLHEPQVGLHNQMQQLRRDLASINQSFRKVANQLDALQTSDIPEEFMDAVRPLGCTWHDIHLTFMDLLWESRGIAGKAGHDALEFSGIFIKDVLMNTDISVADMQDCIIEYKKRVTHDANNASNMINGFRCLGNRVESFYEAWNTIICSNNLRKLTSTYKKYEEQITTLTSGVSVMTFKIRAMGAAVAVLVVATGVLSLIGVIHGDPDAFGFSTMMSIPINLITSKMRDEKSRKKAAKNKVEQLRADRDADEGGLSDIRNIVSKLNGIASIWSSIIADLDDIAKRICAALETPKQPGWRGDFHSYLNSIGGNYEKIAELFHEYQVVVNPDQLKV